MSIDFIWLAGVVTNLVGIGVMVFGIYRAIQIGRAFVHPLYRSRAYWTAVVMAFVIIELANGLVPFGGPIPFFGVLFVLFVFIDRGVLVAIQLDFFHRNSLRWPQVRWGLYAALLGSSALIFVTAGQDIAVLYVFIAAFVGVFSYSAVALAVSARRTSDKTMKRHVRILGLAIVGYAAATLISGNQVSTISLAADAVDLAAVYLIYQVAMSLSPVGRVETDAQPATSVEALAKPGRLLGPLRPELEGNHYSE